MACQKGAVNYNKKVLIEVVAELLPNSNLGWQGVALAYKEKSKETAICDGNDVKNHWMKKLCNSMKKPTGRTGKMRTVFMCALQLRGVYCRKLIQLLHSC